MFWVEGLIYDLTLRFKDEICYWSLSLNVTFTFKVWV
jgi:hypothetical protein